MAKTLMVISENDNGTGTWGDKARGKLILGDMKDVNYRPEYIEIDALNRNLQGEPEIRIKFSDDSRWVGTMADLKSKLIS